MTRWLIALVVAGSCATALTCAGAQTAERGSHPLYLDHQRAVAAFQRLNRPDQAAEALPCLELCHSSRQACESAAVLCDEGDETCAEARSGCGWTLSLMPRSCRYCSQRVL